MDVAVTNKTRGKINEREIIDLVECFAKFYKVKEEEVSIVLVGDTVMRRLNKEYRGYDKPTDILSFEGEEEFLGELIIDMSQLKRQAKFYSDDLSEELLFIITHGLLHLVGYDDEKEEDRLKMIELGKELLARFKKSRK